MQTLLFLYGTLKRGCKNNHLMAGQDYGGPARTLPRYRLHDCGSYPCLVEDAAMGIAIHGELWRVDAEALKRLDEFEEVDDMFVRHAIAVEGVAEPVFAYFFRGDVSGYPRCGPEWPGATCQSAGD